MGTVAIGVRAAAERRWARLADRTDVLSRQLDARPGRRLPLFGPPVPGNAWDDYLAALALLPAPPDPQNPAEAIRLLSRGAHREDAAPVLPPDRRRLGLPPECLQGPAGRLGDAVLARSDLLFKEGKAREATDLLLDLAMFGRDLAARSYDSDDFDGSAAMLNAFRGLRTAIQAGRLDSDALKELGQRLEGLEALWPPMHWKREAALLQLGWMFRREDQDNQAQVIYSNMERPRRQWRYFYSSRLQAAQHFFDAEDLARRASAFDGLPWLQARPELDRLSDEREKHPEPVIQDLYAVTGSSWIRDAQAAARLLRMACRYRATGEVVELEDPFGDRMRTSVNDGRLKAWSRGPFPARPESPEPTGNNREDLQLEVDRR